MNIKQRLMRIFRGRTLMGIKKLEFKNIEAIIADLEERRDKTKRISYEKLVELAEKIRKMTIAYNKAEKNVVLAKNLVKKVLNEGNESRAAMLAVQYEIAKSQCEIAKKAVEEGTVLHEKLLNSKKELIDRIGSEIEILRMKHAQAEMKKEMVDMTGGFSSDLPEDDLQSSFESVKNLIEGEEINVDAHYEVSQKFQFDDFTKPVVEVDNSEALARFREENNC